MELEHYIIKRIKETTDWRWILSVDEDTIDVFIPESKNIDQAVKSLKITIEIFLKESELPKRPVKYLIWNDNKEARSGVSDPDQKSEWIRLI